LTCVYSLYSYPDRRDLHSFPTRRSSDLAGEDLGFVAVLGQQGDGLVGRPGPDVVERGGDHCCTATFVPPPPAFAAARTARTMLRSEEHTSELQSRENLVCRLLLEKKKTS